MNTIRYYKMLLIFTVVLSLNGCFYCTAAVRTIGLKCYQGSTEVDNDDPKEQLSVKLFEYSYKVSYGGHEIVVYDIYPSRCSEDPSKMATININKTKFEKNGKYEFHGKIDDNKYCFYVSSSRVPWTQNKYNLNVVTDSERSGLGMLSQGLMVVTVPVDLLASALFIVSIPIIMPVALLTD